jgi:hypothetical protein
MSFQNKIEQYLSEIRDLEQLFHEVQGKEILPFSFFSSSIDSLNNLKAGIYELEADQLKMMQNHLKKSENEWSEVNQIEEAKEIGETGKLISTTGILADSIVRKINVDFGKSLSLNDRFMFQRDLFQGNTDEMNQAFTQLNAFQSLNEAMEFLNERFVISWNTDSGIAFKELLDKRFA